MPHETAEVFKKIGAVVTRVQRGGERHDVVERKAGSNHYTIRTRSVVPRGRQRVGVKQAVREAVTHEG